MCVCVCVCVYVCVCVLFLFFFPRFVVVLMLVVFVCFLLGISKSRPARTGKCAQHTVETHRSAASCSVEKQLASFASKGVDRLSLQSKSVTLTSRYSLYTSKLE